MKLLSMIEALSNADGISGFEDDVSKVIRRYSGTHVRIDEDRYRNLYIYPKTRASGKPMVMLDGHSDEIGFMVQSIASNGLIKFIPIGGWVPSNVAAQKVRIINRMGQPILGIVASKPPHFMSDAEKSSTLTFPALSIDIGANDKKEVVETYRIEPGAPIVPDVTFSYHEKSDLLIGKAFDNRIGCACVLQTMLETADQSLSVEPVGACSAQEEVGLRGAAITARYLNPDVAIVFEGSPADDRFKSSEESQCKVGHGPQIRHRDSSMIANPRFVQFARKIAQIHGIPFQDAVRESGGTDGGAISVQHTGIPTIVIGVPVRYAHSHYGMASYDDVKKAVIWAKAILHTLDEKVIASF